MSEILCSEEECKYYVDIGCSLDVDEKTPQDALCYVDEDSSFYSNTGVKRKCYRCGKKWRGAVLSGPKVGSLCRECHMIVKKNGIDYSPHNTFKQPNLENFEEAKA